MIEGTASKTAQGQAFLRAIESLAPDDIRVCNDSLAVEFLDERRRRMFQRARSSEFLAKMWLWMLRMDPPGTKAQGIARTRYIDDYLQAGIQSGVEQVAILGAGCDSRAYRIKALEKLRVFEVDHPATQKLKIANVKRLFGQLPPWVTYVSVDFRKESLGERLPTSGYRNNAQTLFVWEGVTMYLTAGAVDTTLSFIAGNSNAGSSVIFDYWYKSAVDGKPGWRWASAVQKTATKAGEPITFGIEGGEIDEFLSARGFCQVNRVAPATLNGLYFTGPNSGRKVSPFTEIVHASVRARA